MRARSLIILIVLGALAPSGCLWSKKSTGGTNLDPSEIPKAGDHPDGRK